MTRKTIVFVGPSAIGKTFAAERLIELYPEEFEQAKLYTTRKRRSIEQPTDRIFIDEKQFTAMKSNDKFIFQGYFADNYYGFDKKSVYPNNKHLLVNAWPKIAVEFSKLDHCILIVMEASSNWMELLTERMKQRGDTSEAIDRRLVMIDQDIQDIKKYSQVFSRSGKSFRITDDSEIDDQVIPAIATMLRL